MRQVRPRWALAGELSHADPQAMSIAAKLIIVLAAALACFAAGVKWQIGIVAARDLKAVQDNARVQILRADKADQAADRYEKTKTKIETRYVEVEKEVQKIVDRPVYRNVCLDEDGMAALKQAIDEAGALEK